MSDIPGHNIEYKKNCGHDICYDAFSGIRRIKSFFPNQTALTLIIIWFQWHLHIPASLLQAVRTLHLDYAIGSPHFLRTALLNSLRRVSFDAGSASWLPPEAIKNGNYRRKNNPFEQQDTLKTDFEPINPMWIHLGAKLPLTTFNLNRCHHATILRCSESQSNERNLQLIQLATVS